MFIRKATPTDIAAADEIYTQARKFMKESGNPNQWNGSHPNGDDVLIGIEKGVSYVCEDNGEVVATFYFEMNADDPTYHKIYDGEWKSDKPYAVIHRIAVKYHGRGIIDFCFNECFKLFPNIRIDTHRDNIPMQKCLSRHGFEYCGIIHLLSGDERLAYQKIK
ncbi:MAG: GNAT family N-acetyltransferase [Clostridia bacterium]|nr:GNAT family N-acetyltransferase [Clostridia bacterium]